MTTRVRFLVKGNDADQCRRNAAQLARMWWGLVPSAAVEVELSEVVEVLSTTSSGEPAGSVVDARFRVTATVTIPGSVTA